MVGQVLEKPFIRVGKFRFDVRLIHRPKSRTQSIWHRYRKYGGCCVYCGHPVAYAPLRPNHPFRATKDHFVPRSDCKTNADKEVWDYNLVLACHRCNQLKGNRPLIVFLAELNRSA